MGTRAVRRASVSVRVFFFCCASGLLPLPTAEAFPDLEDFTESVE